MKRVVSMMMSVILVVACLGTMFLMAVEERKEKGEPVLPAAHRMLEQKAEDTERSLEEKPVTTTVSIAVLVGILFFGLGVLWALVKAWFEPMDPDALHTFY